MSKHFRSGRIGEEIKKIISELLINGLKDPRLNRLMSISAVEVTEDYSYATVYISALDSSDEEKKDILAAFKSAGGFLKREIGRRMQLRTVPELRFKIDTSLEYGLHMAKIIEEVNKESKVRNLSEGKVAKDDE